jgi:hypothetical protein
VRNVSTGHCWSGGGRNPLYGTAGAGALCCSGDVAIESLSSATGPLLKFDTFGQRCDAFGRPPTVCVAELLPNSHQTFPSKTKELPLSPETSP